jgi:3-methylcrotonyl-CoA carboxylase alpha subunit
MFDKILIANRGEIACRVARTARRMGIRCVAVYSDADAGALHVEACDEAYRLGPPPPRESYLRGDRIIDIALRCAAQAIHPGYGFLSENADFAAAVAAAGLTFIGPPAAAIRAMGSKSESKRIVGSAGIPIVPGYHAAGQDDALLTGEAERIGYPVLIKASAGGGGKGMRIVERRDEFIAALASARREAKSAFGDDSMLLEKYLTEPRHIEIQVFADTHGECVHLFERDCSVQRRHQKVLEEAPAPGMTRGRRAEMGAAAVAAAKAIGYVGAGTVEFIVDRSGAFHFMEMNTRLQVEHPVTEMVTGLDLVEWQLRVAAGEPLPLAQDALEIYGHAIEARIYAEDAERGFLPTSGSVLAVRWPRGPGVRVDAGVDGGDSVGTRYDGLLAKLCVHGETRGRAIARLRAALDDVVVLGLTTNLPLLRALAAHPDFEAGGVDTGWLERTWQPETGEGPPPEARAAADAYAASERGASPWQGRWRPGAGEPAVDAPVARAPDGALHVWTGGRDVRIERTALGEPERHARRAAGTAAGIARIVAPMPGAVLRLEVAEGDEVDERTPLLVLEAMKMEHPVWAPFPGRIVRVDCREGQQVSAGDPLLELAAGTPD